MKITDIKIRKLMEEERMKAIVSVTFDDEIAIHDIKVIAGDDRLFVAMPSKKSSDGVYRDIAHPINAVMREKLQEEILKVYLSYKAEKDGAI